MSDPHDWNTWMEAVDDVRPTPDDIKQRIRRRALTGDVELGAEATASAPDLDQPLLDIEPADEPEFAAVVLRSTDPASRPRRRRPIAIAVGVAAAMTMGVLLWLGSADRPPSDVAAAPFPSRSSELACEQVRAASDDFALLTRDGPTPLSAERLAAIRVALAGFVDELELVDSASQDASTRWRSLDAELRQASLFASAGDNDAATVLLRGIRERVFDLVWNSENMVVETCFDDWAG